MNRSRGEKTYSKKRKSGKVKTKKTTEETLIKAKKRRRRRIMIEKGQEVD
jgi:hypothetical protein